MSESEKWSLTEGIEQLFPNDPEMAEVGDLVTYSRQLTLDVSIAEGKDPEDGTEGISVILSLPDAIGSSLDESEDSRSQPLFWDFSCLMVPAQGETMSELAKRIAEALGIKPDERIWQDADETESKDELAPGR